jgi:hypothetical protein
MTARSVGSPHEHIIELGWGYLYSAALNAVTELGVADSLEQGPKSSAALAEELGVSSPALHRTLRLLASVGVFAEDEQGRFGLTPSADVLRTAAPGSMRDAVRMLAHESFWIPAGKLSTTIRTGQTPFAEIFGGSFFDYFAQNPEVGPIFHRGMARSPWWNPSRHLAWSFRRGRCRRRLVVRPVQLRFGS